MTKWWVLFCLYLTQGLPHGFFSQALPALLREQGASLEKIGLMSLVGLPWLLKFLWAPALDHYRPLPKLMAGVHLRKRWIALANLAALVGLFLIGLETLDFWLENELLLILALIVLTFFIVSQDISTDALAVENIQPQQRGLGNSLQVAGYRLGMVVSGGALLAAFPLFGWQGVMWIMAGLMFVVLIPLWFWQPAEPQTSPALTKKDWLVFFQQPHWLAWLLLLLVYKVGDAFGTAMIRPHFIDLGMSLADFAELLGVWGTIAGLIGAVLGGLLLTRLSRFQGLFIFLLLEGVALSSYALIQELDWTLIYALVAFEHIAGGMATVALFTVMMDRCKESSAASDYAIQSSFIIMATMLATGLSGFSASALGYQWHYLLAAGLCVLGLVVLMFNRYQLKETSAS